MISAHFMLLDQSTLQKIFNGPAHIMIEVFFCILMFILNLNVQSKGNFKKIIGSFLIIWKIQPLKSPAC
jgi:hypothetical protein